MTFQVHPPYPAGQCYGPKCTAAARDEDQALIPRFCSDPCRDRFVAEHSLPTITAPNPAPTPEPEQPAQHLEYVVEPDTTVLDENMQAVRETVSAALARRTLGPRVFINGNEVPVTSVSLGRPADLVFVDELPPLFPPAFVARLNETLTAVAAAFASLFEHIRPAMEQLQKLADATPPNDPQARALWLRQNRNTGPATKQQRAPRELDTARRRTR